MAVHRRYRSRTVNLVAVCALAAAVLAATAVAQTAGGKSLLHRAGLTGGDETYTALAFADARNLPLQLPAAGARVAFSVHNAEASGRTYRWTVLALGARGTRVLANGRLPVAKGKTAFAAPSIALPCSRGRLRVQVRLADPPESIGFWTSCTGPRGHSGG